MICSVLFFFLVSWCRFWTAHNGRGVRIHWFLVVAAASCALGGEAQPQQPINFNHKIHIDQKMECTDCHQLATKSRRSGLPTANMCMACHIVIKADNAEVKKIAEYKQKRQSIPWVRLYQVPNFVYYSHQRHVNTGIACATCHGTTGTEPVARATREFTMGFCMDCHKERRVSNDCAVCHQ